MMIIISNELQQGCSSWRIRQWPTFNKQLLLSIHWTNPLISTDTSCRILYVLLWYCHITKSIIWLAWIDTSVQSFSIIRLPTYRQHLYPAIYRSSLNFKHRFMHSLPYFHLFCASPFFLCIKKRQRILFLYCRWSPFLWGKIMEFLICGFSRGVCKIIFNSQNEPHLPQNHFFHFLLHFSVSPNQGQ